MADIRRQVGDVTPNTFVRQGVVDESLSTMVEGLGTAAITLDTGLAKRRFDKAQEVLHAQYVVGSPQADTLQEDSFSDQSPLSPNDARGLKDFKDVLDTQNVARDQGKMNSDSYQLRAERLLRIAIAKRPGLAAEFRNIAASYVGSDVTGAESQYLHDQEVAAAQAAAKVANRDETNKWKLYSDQTELFKSVDMPGYAMFGGPDDPQYQEWFKANAPILQQKLAAKGQLAIAEQAVKLNDATKAYNADSTTALWVAQAEVATSDAASLADNVRTYLVSQNATNDPVAMRGALNQVREGITKTMAQLEVDAQKYGIDSATRGVYRERQQKLLDRVESIISGTDDKALIENANELLLATSRNAMLKNDEYRQVSVLMKDLPPALQERLTIKMEKSLVLTTAKMLQDTALPEDVVRQAPDILPGVISALYKDGSATAADPIGVARFTDIASRAVASYITAGDESFQAAKFTQNPATNSPGTIKVLSNHAAVIIPSLTPDQRHELTTTISAAAGNSLRVLGIGLNTKYPTLRSKVTVDMDFPGGNAFVLKPGVKPESLTTVEKQGLLAYNRAAQAPLLTKVLSAYGNTDAAGASKLIKENYQPGQALKATQKPRTGASSGGSTTQGGQAPSSPSVGAVVKGYRFIGGDPGNRASWEKM